MKGIAVAMVRLLYQWFLTTRGLLRVVLASSFVLTLMGFLSQYGLLFDLPSHFRVQYAILQLVGLPLLLGLKCFRWAALTGLFLALNLSVILPYYWPPHTVPVEAKQAGSERLKLLHMNVNLYNNSYHAAGNSIRQMQPDIVVIEELTPRCLQELSPVLSKYPYRQVEPREDSFGIGVFSRIPLKHSSLVFFSREYAVPSVTATLTIDGHPVTLVATHPLPPTSPVYYRQRNDHLAAIARNRSMFAENMIVIGDLNITPWAHSFQSLLKKAQLRDSQQGFGVQPTWPSFTVLPWIPIDHCLVSENIVVFNRRIGPAIGSDHFPVYLELGLVSHQNRR